MIEAWQPHYKIVPGSVGNFLCPPGHPSHKWSLEGYETARKRNPFSVESIESALADDFDGSDAIKARVRKIFDDAEMVASEAWIRQVYGYFKTCYAPEDGNRDVSKAIMHNPAEIAVGAARKALADTYADPGLIAGLPYDEDNYRDGSAKPMRAARRGYEVSAKRDGSEVFVYTLADDGTRYGSLPLLETHADTLRRVGYSDVQIEDAQNRGDLFIPERVRATNPSPVEPIDPNRHLAVLRIRKYFPDHEIRHDLIENLGKGYGAYPCTKCGETVQYEAKFDKLAAVSTRMDGRGMTHRTYKTECTDGGDHTTD